MHWEAWYFSVDHTLDNWHCYNSMIAWVRLSSLNTYISIRQHNCYNCVQWWHSLQCRHTCVHAHTHHVISLVIVTSAGSGCTCAPHTYFNSVWADPPVGGTGHTSWMMVGTQLTMILPRPHDQLLNRHNQFGIYFPSWCHTSYWCPAGGLGMRHWWWYSHP